jgi:hypothetical protein
VLKTQMGVTNLPVETNSVTVPTTQ